MWGIAELAAHVESNLKLLPYVWHGAVQRCDAIIIIGAAVNDADDHIWRPVRSARAVYYIGSPKNPLGEWLGERYHFLGDTFQCGMPGLLQMLS